VKWLVPEPLSDAAEAVLAHHEAGDVSFFAPDTIVAEFGHSMRKLVLGGAISTEKAFFSMDEFLGMTVERVPADSLARKALRLAISNPQLSTTLSMWRWPCSQAFKSVLLLDMIVVFVEHSQAWLPVPAHAGKAMVSRRCATRGPCGSCPRAAGPCIQPGRNGVGLGSRAPASRRITAKSAMPAPGRTRELGASPYSNLETFSSYLPALGGSS